MEDTDVPHEHSEQAAGARRRVQRGWAALVGAGLLVTAAAASRASDVTTADAGGGAAPVVAAERTAGAGLDSYADLVSRVSPSVVTIRAERRTRAPQQFPFADDPFFRRFFGERQQGPAPFERSQAALGSGVIARADGHIVTNHHVIDGAENITVELADRRIVQARVVGSDAPSDLAVLKVEADDLQPITLGDSGRVDVGDVVLALGNPLGVGQTVTMGIISGKGRATGLGDGSFEDFLQTDAPINSGNSGGALVNTRGELVGINSQILSPSGGNIGIGFAIPVSMAKHVMEQLIDHGSVRRARLGVTAQTIDSRLARSLGLKEVRGALVGDIASGSPADRAGLRRGDVILAVDGAPVSDSNALRNLVASSEPGSQVTLTFVRDGREQSVAATLAELQPAGGGATVDGPGPEGRGTFGLRVEPLDPARARELGVKVEKGLVVGAVAPGSRADEAGLRAEDVIASVDGRAVATLEELRSALQGGSERPALVLVHRGEQTLFVTLER
jgi:Do/DeqQ family serine protease